MTVDLESEHLLWIDYACANFCNLCKLLELYYNYKESLCVGGNGNLLPITGSMRPHVGTWGHEGSWNMGAYEATWGHMRASIRAFEGTWRPHTASWVLFWQEPHTLAMDCGWPMWFEQFSTSAPQTRDGCNSIKRTIKIEFLRCPAARIFLWVG